MRAGHDPTAPSLDLGDHGLRNVSRQQAGAKPDEAVQSVVPLLDRHQDALALVVVEIPVDIEIEDPWRRGVRWMIGIAVGGRAAIVVGTALRGGRKAGEEDRHHQERETAAQENRNQTRQPHSPASVATARGPIGPGTALS
jgi:hypothetical protein